MHLVLTDGPEQDSSSTLHFLLMIKTTGKVLGEGVEAWSWSSTRAHRRGQLV